MFWGRKSRGIITVFVTLIMVPIVVCTGMFVDIARMKLYSSQAAMAADSYGSVVLSEYDNLLKELYGLFSVTQNKDGLKALEELAEHTGYSFNPNGDNLGVEGFMPYAEANPVIKYEKVENADLMNTDVLMSQVSEFMKFRIVEEALEEGGLLDTFEEFTCMKANMEAVEARTEITKDSSDALEEINNYYVLLKAIDDYPAYIADKKSAYKNYSDRLIGIYGSKEYKAYVTYLENKTDVDEAVDKKARIEEQEKHNEEMDEKKADLIAQYGADADLSSIQYVTVEEWTTDDQKYYDMKVDVEDYTGGSNRTHGIGKVLENLSKEAKKEEYLVCFEDGMFEDKCVEDKIDKLGKSADKLDAVIGDIKTKITTMEASLAGCSEDIKEGMTKEIEDLKEITELGDDFKATYNLLIDKKDKEKNSSNAETFNDNIAILDEVKEKLIKGTLPLGGSIYWEEDISFDWYDFRDDKETFFEELKTLCETEGNVTASKKAADKKIDAADDETEKAQKELNAEETTDARNITKSLQQELEVGSQKGDSKSFTDYMAGGMSFDGIGQLGNELLGKFLLVSYDQGMFSSRVSGIEPPKVEEADGNVTENVTEGITEEISEETESKEPYFDESLTKVKMSKDINYLYGAELEYLYGGNTQSKDNLAEVRNVICGVRFTMNFASTYTISEVHKAIEDVANWAALAASSTGIGAAAAPLIRVAVSGAIRAAVATWETVKDWNSLKEREEVVFFKMDLEDLAILPDDLGRIIGQEPIPEAKGEKKSSIKLSYEDYMFVLLCFMVNKDDLAGRTSDLITLNVNQSLNETSEDLKTLSFKMANTVTAVKATCEIQLDFVVVPENFMKMYMSNTTTESIVQQLNDGGYQYTVIRGY